MAIKLTNRDVIWSYMGTVVSLGVYALALPLAMVFLDADMFGMWSVFISLGSLTTLFDFGFSVTFARNITYCWSGANDLLPESIDEVVHEGPNFALMKQVLTTCKLVYLAISGVALALMLTVGTAYIAHIGAGLPGNEHIIAWVIYAVSIFLSIYYGYYTAFLRGVGAVGTASRDTVLARLLLLVCLVGLLWAGFGIIGASASYLVYGIVFRLLCKRDFYRYQDIGRNLDAVVAKVPKGRVRELFGIVWHNAWREGLISLSGFIATQATVIICSLVLTLSETGIYSLSVQIATAVAHIAATLYLAYQPALQERNAANDRPGIQRIMAVIVASTLWIAIGTTVLVLVIGLPILAFIKPDAYIDPLVVTALCFYHLLLRIRDCYASYFSCSNRIPYVTGYCAAAFASIALSYIAAGTLGLGVWGLVGAQIVSQASWNAWIWPLRGDREMGVTFVALVRQGTVDIVRMVRQRLGR